MRCPSLVKVVQILNIRLVREQPCLLVQGLLFLIGRMKALLLNNLSRNVPIIRARERGKQKCMPGVSLDGWNSPRTGRDFCWRFRGWRREVESPIAGNIVAWVVSTFRRQVFPKRQLYAFSASSCNLCGWGLRLSIFYI